MERGFKGSRAFFFFLCDIMTGVAVGCGWRYGGYVESVFAKEYRAGFVVNLLVGSENGGMEVVFGLMTGNGTFDGCRGDEEVCIDVQSEFWGEDIEEG